MRSVRSTLTTLLAALLCGATLLVTAPLVASSTGQSEPQRVVAIGDVHGAFEPFVQILQAAGLVDAKQQWAGGSAIFVQTGDVFDRGPGVRDALDLLMHLEDQAKRADGRVEALLGNHEVMNIIGDFRDVSAAAYATFADGRSDERRKRAYQDVVRIEKRKGPSTSLGAGGKAIKVPSEEEWMKSHPAGFVEYADAMGPRGKYGKWLRSHKVVATIDGTAFMHAGIHPDLAGTLEDINRTAAREIAAVDETRAAMVQAQLVPPFCTLNEMLDAAATELERISAAIQAKTPLEEHVTRELVDRLQALLAIGKSSLIAGEGPLWFRGFAQWADTDDQQVTDLLRRFNVKRFVTGHTPSLPGRIRARFGNRIFLIDTGMLSTYFKGGRASALELQGDRFTAIYADSKEVIGVAPK